VSNQDFARAENLISPYRPSFDPKLFGPQGKVMDSWESTRHNSEGVDEVEFTLERPCDLKYLSLSTEYHDGNQVEWIEVFADQALILPKTQLMGHSLRQVRLDEPAHNVSQVVIKTYPDGGLSRVGLFAELPSEVALNFKLNRDAENIRFAHDIDVFKKVYQARELTLDYPIAHPNYTSAELGASILKTGDEHYSYTVNVLSNIKPIGMFDGFESKRSREAGHSEEVIIQLGQKINPHCLRFDFTYFVNNNPRELQVDYRGQADEPWRVLIPRAEVKAFAGNIKDFIIREDHMVDQLRVTVYPDGGINRIQTFAKI
jgi:allantoicase